MKVPFFLYRSRSFGCYYSIPFVSYQKKEIGGGYCRRAPLVISSRYLICLLFFPRTPPPSPGRLSCVREYLGRSIKRQLRHAVRSNWRFDRHLHTNVFSVSFFPLLNLWKAQISSDDWRCPGHSYELHEAINRSRWEKETGLSCPFHKWENTRAHCSCLPEEEGEERRSMSALTFPTVLGRHSPRDYQEFYIVEYVDDRIEKLFAPSQSTAGHTFTVKRVGSSFP